MLKKMKTTCQILIVLFIIINISCYSQNKKNMQEQNNPLLCDPESGTCEIPTDKISSTESSVVKANKKPIKIIYYTDPYLFFLLGY